MNTKDYLKTAIKAAKTAGKILLKNYDKKQKITYKSKKEIVTTADKKSEESIIKTIKTKFPNHSFWSEEMKEIKNSPEYRWIIDPLDGTFVYSHKIPFFGISIALEHKKNIITGVTYFPALNLLYHAEKGKGSYCNGKKIKVSKNENKNQLFYIISTNVIRKKDLVNIFRKKLVERTLHIKDFGSCALAMSLVAEGKADACFEFGIKQGDIAAGILIIKEAKGKTININGNNATAKDKNIIGYNGKLNLTNTLKKAKKII